jgi:class 3 adenylate cyclase
LPKLTILFLFIFAIFGYTKATNADTTSILNLIAAATEQEQNANYLQEIALAKKAFQLSKKLSFSKGLSSACMRIGAGNFNLGKVDTALYYYKLAYAIRKNQQEPKSFTSTCLALSELYVSTSKYDSAFSVLFNALRYNQTVKDSGAIAEILIELGNLSVDYKDLKGAKNYLLDAAGIANRLNSAVIKIQSSSALGKYYFELNDFKTALKYFLRVNDLTTVHGEKTMRATNLNNIGLCYSGLMFYKEATHFFKMGLAVYKELDMQFDIGNTCFNLGNMYNNRKMPDSAIYYLNQSKLIANSIKDIKHLALSYEYLADAYVLKNDYRRAYEYTILSTQINDSIINSDKITSISEMQTRYQTELKSKEINILHKENELAKLKTSQSRAINVALAIALIFIICTAFVLYKLNRKEQKLNLAITLEKEKSDNLLLNILPEEVAEELKLKGSAEAKQFDEVTVLFTDFKDFTQIAETMTATELVNELNIYFKAFDNIITRLNIEKIKTIGDSYMCVGGLPTVHPSHATDVVSAGLEIQAFVENHSKIRQQNGKEPIQIRIGIHTGPVVAGIVGIKKYAYDIWGDTVNTASRMESSGEAGKVNISQNTYELVKDQFRCSPRGKIMAKHKGEMEMYFVDGKI